MMSDSLSHAWNLQTPSQSHMMLNLPPRQVYVAFLSLVEESLANNGWFGLGSLQIEALEDYNKRLQDLHPGKTVNL